MQIPWWKQKTTWTAIAGFVTAIGGALSGDISWTTAVGAAFAAAIAIFARQGIEKSKG